MSTNPQGNKPINQKRGPTTGNVATGSKRATFMAEKSAVNSERATIANMITDALGMRGKGQAGYINPALESVHSKTNVGRGPTKGNAGKK